MKIGFILTTFPCRTETFAIREIEDLKELGFDITIFAATRQQQIYGNCKATKVYYRPHLFSTQAIRSIFYLLFRYPLALCKLFFLILRLCPFCSREAISLIGNFHTIGFFAKYLDREAIPCIHAYFLSWPAIVGLGLSMVTGRPFSVSAHARDIFVEAGALHLKIKHSRFIAICNKQGLEHIKSQLPVNYHSRLHLIYHGISEKNTARWYSSNKGYFNSHTRTVIGIGRLVEKKGFEYLLRAFAMVAETEIDVRLIIVGDGPKRKQLVGLTHNLGMDNYVKFLGWQDYDHILKSLREADLLIVPSIVAKNGDRDGVPNVILEAFAVGTPVIASKLPGICEVIEHRETGLLVPPANVELLAQAMRAVLDDRELTNQLVNTANAVVRCRFDSARNVKSLAQRFETCIV